VILNYGKDIKMAERRVYYSIDGFTQVINATVNSSHGSPTTNAVIECIEFTKDIGDPVTIDLGYEDDHGIVFKGFNKYIVTCYDTSIRLSDFFIVSSTPANPLKYRNIKAEDLVEALVNLAGIDDYYGQETFFTFGINNAFEVNLVSAYDYIKTIADVLSWNIYCTQDGQIRFVNRKPHVMTGDSGQPGDVADVPFATAYDLNGSGDDKILEFSYHKSEKDLRNKVVVYGRGNLSATASAVSPYLPNNPDGSPFYKTVVVASPIIDTVGIAQLSADYNLQLYNRLSEQCSIKIEGRHDYDARKVITLDERLLSVTGNWYIYSCEHSFSREQGYTVSMELRK
jgi:hypothetical protein